MSAPEHFGSFRPEAFASLAKQLLDAARAEAQFAPLRDDQIPQATLSAAIQLLLSEAGVSGDITPDAGVAAMSSALASWVVQKTRPDSDAFVVEQFGVSCTAAMRHLRALQNQAGSAR